MKTRTFFLLALLCLLSIIIKPIQLTSLAAHKFPDNQKNISEQRNNSSQSVYSELDGITCNFLIVDDDWDFDQTVDNDGGRPYYTSAFDSLGYIYSVWEINSQGEPTITDLQNYSTVIWFTGYAWNNTIKTDNEIQIAAYLDGGGNFVLSSEDYYADTGIVNSFMQTYLGIASIDNDKNEIDVIGNSTNPIGNNLGPFSLTRPDDWATYWPLDLSEGPYTDYVVAASGTSSPFRFSGSSKNNSTNKEGSGWKTVFLAWPFEWIDTVSERAIIMRNIINWTNPECEPIFTFLPLIIKSE